MEWIIRNIDEWKPIASYVFQHKTKNILLLKGEMGAGKTSFTSFLLDAMNSEDAVSSPTYAIVNEYKTKFNVVYHFDLYRLKDIEELEAIGFYEYLEKGGFCIIEWAERFPEAFRGYEVHTMEIEEIEGVRKVSFS